MQPHFSYLHLVQPLLWLRSNLSSIFPLHLTYQEQRHCAPLSFITLLISNQTETRTSCHNFKLRACLCLSSSLYIFLESTSCLLKMLYTPSKRCLCLLPPSHSQLSSTSVQHFKMSSPSTETVLLGDQANAIPFHPALNLSSSTLMIILDFGAYPSTFWTGEDFIPYRRTLLSTLPLHFASPPPSHQTKGTTKLLITTSFPHCRTQFNSIRLTHRDLIARIELEPGQVSSAFLWVEGS
jgi:hypothetical protein